MVCLIVQLAGRVIVRHRPPVSPPTTTTKGKKKKKRKKKKDGQVYTNVHNRNTYLLPHPIWSVPGCLAVILHRSRHPSSHPFEGESMVSTLICSNNVRASRATSDPQARPALETNLRDEAFPSSQALRLGMHECTNARMHVGIAEILSSLPRMRGHPRIRIRGVGSGGGGETQCRHTEYVLWVPPFPVPATPALHSTARQPSSAPLSHQPPAAASVESLILFWGR